MLDGYVTVKEKAKEWGMSVRGLQTLCSSGKIDGAVKFGTVWAIPADAEHPPDGRITTGMYVNWRKKKQGK